MKRQTKTKGNGDFVSHFMQSTKGFQKWVAARRGGEMEKAVEESRELKSAEQQGREQLFTLRCILIACL